MLQKNIQSLVTLTRQQRGATLIELLVGITIGLLTVVVGLGALMMTRGVSGTVSEASQMQQQASYAFRVIGQQLRQSGGLAIDPTTGAKEDVQWPPITAGTTNAITGKDAPSSSEYKFSLTYQTIPEPLYTSPTASTTTNGYLLRNCLGENPDKGPAILAPLVQSNFKLDADSNLVCAGTSVAQPIISGVKDFQVTYLQQVLNPADQQPLFRYAKAADLTTPADWSSVYAVEVCLELEGNEYIDTAGSTYRDCRWKIGDSEKSRGNKMRTIYRNTFFIRNQAWPA